jgi:hypothetical protein
MEFASTTAFAIILALFVLRAPTAIRRRAARPAWLASGFAIIGLLTLGFIVPLDPLEDVLGNASLWNLTEAVCSTCAFWCLFRAMGVATGGTARPRIPWIPALLIGSYLIPFLFIEYQGSTCSSFVSDHIRQVQCLLYLVNYLVGVGLIASASLWRLRIRREWAFWPFLLGYGAVVVSIPLDIVYLSLTHLEVGEPRLRLAFWDGFTLFFYAGVLLLALGFLLVYLRATLARVQPDWRIRAVRLTRLESYLGIAEHNSRPRWEILRIADPVGSVYGSLVRIRDQQAFRGAILSRSELTVVEAAEAAFERSPALKRFADHSGSELQRDARP